MPFDAKTWENTRPSCCKDSGVGGACKTWAKSCPADPKTLVSNDTALQAAASAIDLMKKALTTAEGKLSGAKDKDLAKVVGTKKLIADWRKDADEYRKKITLALAAESQKNRAAAEKEIDDAFKVTQGYQAKIAVCKRDIKAIADKVKPMVATAEKNPLALSEVERKSLVKNVELFGAKAGSIAINAAELGTTHRSALADYRLRGASGIAKDHGVDDKGAAELGKRFSEHMKIMTEFERDVKTVGMLAEQVNVDTVSVQELSKKTWDVIPGYKKILEAIVNAWTETNKTLVSTLGKTNPGTVLKKLSGTAPEKMITDQIQIGEDKIVTLGKIDKRMTPLTDTGLSRIPQDFQDAVDLSPLIKQIKKFADDFDLQKTAFIKECQEGIAHGKKILPVG